MLHTLLPEAERKILHREYKRRVLTVFMLALSSSVVLGICALFPTFIKARAEGFAAGNLLDSVKYGNSQNGAADIRQKIDAGLKLLTSLDQDLSYPRNSMIIERLVRSRGSVDISSIDIENNATSSVMATIRGLAPTRDSLLSFKSRLENDIPGGKVNLPISELAQDADISFSIQINMPLP